MSNKEADASLLQVYDVMDFLKLKTPPRQILLQPWLHSGSLSMVFAPRGVGKTFFAMNLSHALATGGRFLRWEAPQPMPVLYIDGEMPACVMQERWKPIIELGGAPAPGMLRTLSRDVQELRDLPNMATSEGLNALSECFGDAKLVVVDNLSSLMHGAKENEAEGWEPVEQWAIRERAQGRSILFIHHAGKSGRQRGTSAREDVLDIVIRLGHAEGYRQEEGARFEVQFEKARSVFGSDVAPFEARLIDGRWVVAEIAGDAALLDLKRQGLSTSRIGEILGCDKSTVSRRLAKLEGSS